MEWLKIAIRKSTLLRAIAALLWSATHHHEEARHEKDSKRSQELRREGDADAQAHDELWNTQHRNAIVHDASIKENSAPVQQLSMTEHSKLLPWLMMCAILSGLATSMSLVCAACTWWLASQYHVLQVIVQDQDALMIRSGLKDPEDTIWGPSGNLQKPLHKPKPPEK